MCYIYSFWGIVSYLAIASSPSQKIPPTVMYDIKNHRKICMPSTHYRGVFARICQFFCFYNNSIYIIHVTIMILWRSKNHICFHFCVASVEKTQCSSMSRKKCCLTFFKAETSLHGYPVIYPVTLQLQCMHTQLHCFRYQGVFSLIQ